MIGAASPSRRAMPLLLVVGLAVASPLLAGEAWLQERWTVEPFTQTLSGGPRYGPLAQSGWPAGSTCQAPDGHLFMAYRQQIDIVDRHGFRWALAGDGQPGFRDGPAEQARFRLGMGAHYGMYQIFCAEDGSVLLPDAGNGRIRRLVERNGRWHVETLAGGGRYRLRPGDERPAGEVRLGGTLAVAQAPDGTIYIGTPGGYLRLREGRLRHMGPWPRSAVRFPGSGKPVRLNPFGADVDGAGQVLFFSRTPDVVVRIRADGRAEHVAGVTGWRRKPHHLGDGPPLEAFFDTPGNSFADPQAAAAFVGGGDEYNIRRVPTDGHGTTATLMQDGRWHRLPRHPNAGYRGGAVFRPGHRPGPGERLRVLMIGALYGRDRRGALLARLKRWSGMSLYVEGRGLLPTRLYRIRRLP